MTLEALKEQEAELPAKTSTYTPIPNIVLIESVYEEIDKNNLRIVNEDYSLGSNGNQLFGRLIVEGENEGLQQMIGFRNSYNKTLPIGLATGANVIVCSNLMFTGDVITLRKHSKYAHADLKVLVGNAVDKIAPTFERISKDVRNLKQVTINKSLAAQLVGDMFMNEEVIKATQLTEIKRQWDLTAEQVNIQDYQTGWNFMQHVTESLKKEHVSTRINAQIKAHDYVINKLVNERSFPVQDFTVFT